MQEKESRGTGRSRSYGGLKDYETIRKEIIDKIWKFPKKTSSMLKYAASRIIAVDEKKLHDTIVKSIKPYEFYAKKPSFYDNLRDRKVE